MDCGVQVRYRSPQAMRIDPAGSGCGGERRPRLGIDQMTGDFEIRRLPELIGRIGAFLDDEQLDER